MSGLTAGEAFAAYEAVRHRLPAPAAAQPQPRRVRDLRDLAERFDVFLLDAFGVLNIGETAIPGTPERVRALRAAGKQVLVVSNAASLPGTALREKYRRLGYDFAPQEVVTSRDTLAAELRASPPRRWGLMVPQGSDLSDLALDDPVLLADAPQDFAEAEGFLLVGSAGWTERRQALLVEALRHNPRPVLVANPDIVAPRETGFSAEPGHFAHRLADQTGLTPRFFGKPFANIYELAFARLGAVDRDRVLMVGDSLHTDVLGAQAAGIASALVAEFGFFAEGGAEEAIARCGIAPDFVIDRP